ncbi:unnamed protein product [Rodentolepis nana]|uniref:HTH CENPB-type domain-containing protein n=1 Tax=Rodentolepis nana TaxID=102285 RepID=A0A0R3T7L6_RODNA|nr:unnamed protein product [Rodentolepis nana]
MSWNWCKTFQTKRRKVMEMNQIKKVNADNQRLEF